MEYQTFEQFYPFYLSQHANLTNRRLHTLGTTLGIICLVRLIFAFTLMNFLLVPIVGYGFAWVGHFFFEKNKPATFKYPLWSLMGDFRMYKEVVTGQRKF
jgi:hypothetical protein